MRWDVRLVETDGESEVRCPDVMEIVRPDDPGDIANPGLTLSEAKRLQACVQQEITAAQAISHGTGLPGCRSCGGECHLKDYREHRIATLFGQVTVRLPRFRCVACSATEAAAAWPLNCRPPAASPLRRLKWHARFRVWAALRACRSPTPQLALAAAPRFWTVSTYRPNIE